MKTTHAPAPANSDRFGWAIAAIFLVVCGVGTFLVLDLYRSYVTGGKSYSDAIRGLELIGQLRYQTQEARRILLYALATRDSNKQVEYADESRAAEAQAAKCFRESGQLANSPEEVEAVQKLENDWKSYLKIRDELIASMLEGNPKEAIEHDLRDGVPAFNKVRDKLQGVERLFRSEAGRLLRQMDVSFQRSLIRLMVILGLSLALATVAAKMIQKGTLLRVSTASEAQLRRSRQKFETLVNSIAGVVWEADPQTFQFSFVSQQAAGLLGIPLEEWLTQKSFWMEHLHPEDRERAIHCRREAVVGRGDCRLEYRMLDAGGQEVWIQESASVVLEGEEVNLLRGVLFNITEQKVAEAELRAVHKQLVETSRRAGMAEVATGVLHNVGNVLNSVNVSATLVQEQLRQSRVTGLAKAGARLREHASDLKTFLFEDSKGRLLPEYLIQVSGQLTKERDQLLHEMTSLTKNVSHIKDIVAMQQSYAGVAGVMEKLPVAGLVEDALQINSAGFARHGVEVVREFEDLPPMPMDKHKTLQILVNLASNAKYALEASGRPDRRLLLKIGRNGNNRAKIIFADNGVGIAPENLTRIFSLGFTTKANGHGFGLHSAALAAKQMGGSLHAHSDGVGLGATFTLELPLSPIEG